MDRPVPSWSVLLLIIKFIYQEREGGSMQVHKSKGIVTIEVDGKRIYLYPPQAEELAMMLESFVTVDPDSPFSADEKRRIQHARDNRAFNTPPKATDEQMRRKFVSVANLFGKTFLWIVRRKAGFIVSVRNINGSKGDADELLNKAEMCEFIDDLRKK